MQNTDAPGEDKREFDRRRRLIEQAIAQHLLAIERLQSELRSLLLDNNVSIGDPPSTKSLIVG